AQSSSTKSKAGYNRSSSPSSPVLEPKEDKVSSPTQGNSSVSEYIKMIKLYAISIGKDLDDIDVKEKFLVGLSPDNEKRVEEFGIKKPLSEIFNFLHEIADDLSAHGTKIANELDGKNNTTITVEIKRILTDDVYRKLIAEINTKIINELSTRLSEINTELNSKLIAEITKINTRDAGYASEVQKIFSMVNNITTKVNNIEEACRNEFSRINVVIEDLQNKINQHYTVVQRSDFDQQNEDFQIIEEYRISGQEFFKLTKEELRDYGLKERPATRITKFFEEL
ncbi:4940_t:CDS:2, partial [Dentiscutata erythropus]